MFADNYNERGARLRQCSAPDRATTQGRIINNIAGFQPHEPQLHFPEMERLGTGVNRKRKERSKRREQRTSRTRALTQRSKTKGK